MDSETYWAERAKEREKYWFKKSQDTIEKELARYYLASLGRIQDDIAALYGRFATDNGLTMAEARKLLTGGEYRQWRMNIEDYVAKIEATGDKGLERELNVLAMRSRISRLDKLYGETLMELDNLGRKVSDRMRSFLTDAYKDNYYHRLYDIGKQGQLRNAVSKVDPKDVEDVLRTRWSGKNYSERIWKNQRFFAKTLKEEMVNAVHRGEAVSKISKRLAKKMDVEQWKATRLVRTELNYVENCAAVASIKDAGMKHFRFIATLDKRTSQVCRDHDGHVYEVDDAHPGDNMPPLHPNCRSTIAGSLYGPDHTKTGERIARNDKGKTYYVPADMKYEDWQVVYVDKKISLAEWESEHAPKINRSTAISFTPAKTLKEAQDFAAQFFEKSFMDKTFKGVADYSGITLDVANQINESLNAVYQQLNISKLSGIKSVKPSSRLGKKAFKDGADAIAAYDPIQHGIYLNRDILGSAKKFQDYIHKSEAAWRVVMDNLDNLSGQQLALAKKYKEAGRSLVDGITIKGAIWHELGHFISWEDIPTALNNSLGDKMKQFAVKLSGYATSSKNEYLAESFGAYMKGELDELDPDYCLFMDSLKRRWLENKNKALW